MASDSGPAELTAFRDLEQLVGALADELATFRRRAQQAEARIKSLDKAGSGTSLASLERIQELERENAELRRRLEAATDRTRQMLDRVRFLRQQQGREVEK